MPPPRLYVLVARVAPVALVLRRGPTEWFHLLRWDLDAATVEPGAWFHGTIYPRRCEISSDGRLFAYFALTGRPAPWDTCYAVLKVPWLTALAAWHMGTTYAWGSEFLDDGSLAVPFRPVPSRRPAGSRPLRGAGGRQGAACGDLGGRQRVRRARRRQRAPARMGTARGPGRRPTPRPSARPQPIDPSDAPPLRPDDGTTALVLAHAGHTHAEPWIEGVEVAYPWKTVRARLRSTMSGGSTGMPGVGSWSRPGVARSRSASRQPAHGARRGRPISTVSSRTRPRRLPGHAPGEAGLPFGRARGENRPVSDGNSWWRARWVAWTIGLTSIALMVANLVLMYVDRNVVLPEASDGWSLTNVFGLLVTVGVPVIGLVIAARRPENPIGWLLLAAGFALGLGGFSRAYALHALIAEPGTLPGGRVFGWIANAIWPIPVALLPFLFLLFPDGHLPSSRWRPVAWFAGASLALDRLHHHHLRHGHLDPAVHAGEQRAGRVAHVVRADAVLDRRVRDPGRDVPLVRVARRQVLSVGGSRARATQVVRDGGPARRGHVHRHDPHQQFARLSVVRRLAAAPLRGHRHRHPQAPSVRHRLLRQQGGRLRTARGVHHDRVRRDRRGGRRVRRGDAVPVARRHRVRRDRVPARAREGEARREPRDLRQARHTVRGPLGVLRARERDVRGRASPSAHGAAAGGGNGRDRRHRLAPRRRGDASGRVVAGADGAASADRF